MIASFVQASKLSHTSPCKIYLFSMCFGAQGLSEREYLNSIRAAGFLVEDGAECVECLLAEHSWVVEALPAVER